MSRPSPFFGLKGTDNQVAFTTVRYRKNPLVITGPGAGPAVTAAGVLNDMLRLTYRRRPAAGGCKRKCPRRLEATRASG